MIFTTRAARARIEHDYEEWLDKHRDPRDPNTLPLSLMMALFMEASSWRVMVRGLFVALGLMLVVDTAGHWIALRLQPVVTMRRADEARAMQAWVNSGVAIRLMRCEGAGTEYVGNGSCHTVGNGAWKLPADAVTAIEAEQAARAQAAAPKDPFGQ